MGFLEQLMQGLANIQGANRQSPSPSQPSLPGIARQQNPYHNQPNLEIGTMDKPLIDENAAAPRRGFVSHVQLPESTYNFLDMLINPDGTRTLQNQGGTFSKNIGRYQPLPDQPYLPQEITNNIQADHLMQYRHRQAPRGEFRNI